MFKLFSKKRRENPFPVSVTARINDHAEPIDRGDRYEDPLQEALEAAGLGEVTGGGSQLGESGEIQFCDVEISLRDAEDATIRAVTSKLEALGAPRGSRLIVSPGREIGFGRLEGLAVYLNGTDLPDQVYQDCDSNHVYEEFERLVDGVGKIHGTWQGPTETAFYLYGSSASEMRSRLESFLSSYPLCQKARIAEIK